MPRSTPEWVGKTDDAAIPPRVRLRVLDRAGHRCQKCTKFRVAGEAWGCDHVVAIINGGMNAESNLQALCENCHRSKTRLDIARKALTAASKKRHLGLKKSKNPMPGSRGSKWKRKMNGTLN